MSARLALFAVLLAGTFAVAAPRRVYVVSWGRDGEETVEQRALIEQVDRRLRDELRRCGAAVVEGPATSSAIVLRPSLEIFPRALKLSLVGVRGGDRKLLGIFSTRAAGSSRDAQLRAIVTRVCRDADQLE
ncbi:MAG: hypothetical protein Q8L48_21380 [Archangium sp.]|nr:hypothetical protein [Archangium sp.]